MVLSGDIARPAKGAAGLNHKARCGAKDIGAVIVGLGVEEAPARKGRDIGADALRVQELRGLQRDSNLGAGGGQGDVAGPVGFVQDVANLSHTVSLACFCANLQCFLPG